MPIRLPAHFRARTVPDETRVALSCGNNQKPRDGIHAVQKALSPIENPIGRECHAMAPLCLYARVNVSEIDRSGTGIRDNPKVVSHRKQWIERSQRVCYRVIAAGNISLDAEPRLEPPRWDCVTIVGGESPCADVR